MISIRGYRWAPTSASLATCYPFSTGSPSTALCIQAYQAWYQTVGSPSVLVADVDTGVDNTHPDLVNNDADPNAFADAETVRYADSVTLAIPKA